MAYTYKMKNVEHQSDTLVVQRLNELIDSRGISKADMARIAGVSPQSVNGWFKRGSISKDAAIKLSTTLQIPVAWVLGEDADEHGSLTSDERRLLELFRQFPIPEKRNMLAAFEMRLQELRDYLDRYVRDPKKP